MRKDLLRFFETDAAPRILPQTLALARVKMEAHRWYNSYTTLRQKPYICQKKANMGHGICGPPAKACTETTCCGSVESVTLDTLLRVGWFL